MKGAKSNNKFLKVLITAQRAKQLHKGAHPLIQGSGVRSTRIALEEVERGLINFEFVDQSPGLKNGHDNRVDSPGIAKGTGNQVVNTRTEE
jgi:DNA-directed RNA polymerase subunit K/omega